MYWKPYKESIDRLTSYAPVYLFTSDTPNAKEKKSEARLSKIVDSFHNCSNYAMLREAYLKVYNSFELGFNTMGLDSTLVECGELQAMLEHHAKGVSNKIKPEPVLKDYYKTENIPCADFSKLFEAVIDNMTLHGNKIPCDVVKLKTLYYNAYKSKRKGLKGEWK